MKQNIRKWLTRTVREREESPQDWPARKETTMEEELFWAYLEVNSFMDYGKGKEKWVYRIGVYRGPEAQIEVYFGLISGSKDILQYMKEQLQKRCEKEISFLNRLCSKLSEKDEDDFYGDFW